MPDNTSSADVDAFMLAADKAAMRSSMDLGTAATTAASAYATAAQGAKADTAVQNTGNETVGGIKTFSSFPVTPSSAPTTDYQTANKKYVDDNIPAALVTESTTSRTLGLSDANKYIRLTSGSSCTITLPNQATVTWLADTEIYFRVAAAGIPTFTLGGSVVLNDPKGVVAALVQGDAFAIKRVASDTWDLI